MSLLAAGAIVIVGVISFVVLGNDSTDPDASVSHEEHSEIVTLMVKRASNIDSFPWERVQVPADQVDAKMEELLSDPDVLAVEKDLKVFAD